MPDQDQPTDPTEAEIRHEAEMGAEEFLGHPLAGQGSAERATTLQARVDYLTREIELLKNVSWPEVDKKASLAELDRLTVELKAALKLRDEFQAQDDGRN